MNIVRIINSSKLYDLYDQMFDYFNLAIYDLESKFCLLYTSPSPRDGLLSRMPSSA